MNFISKFFKNIKSKSEQKKHEKEQKKTEEFEKLRDRQRNDNALVISAKTRISEFNLLFRELEEMIKKNTAMYTEFEDKTNQVNELKEKKYKFVFGFMKSWKLGKLTSQCEKQKKEIDESEEIVNEKKSEIKNSIHNLLKTFS